MQAREALSSQAAQFETEVGLPHLYHALALKGICCFAARTVASRTGSPMPLAGPPLRDLVGTAHALPVFPSQMAAASLDFPSMPSQWPYGPCLLPK